MQQIPRMQWDLNRMRQCEKESGQALLYDEHLLAGYAQDFGKIVQSTPRGVCVPSSVEKIQSVLHYANQNNLPVTIRGKGLSQGGQSLAVNSGLTLHLEKINNVLDKESSSIWVEANASWSALLDISLKTSQIPCVLPYNCNLSIGGVLSAAGMGASSFKAGSVSAHVDALEVVLANGELKVVEADSPLFTACLSGQGLFAVITKARIKLRPCFKRVKTFFLVYHDREQWFHDIGEIKEQVDYIEAFCTPSFQGSKLAGDKRIPFAQWLFVIHASVEYENKAPAISTIKHIHPWKLIHEQEESIYSYLHRHDSRFEIMKLTGQWELFHPWYECFMTAHMLTDNLDELLTELPLHYATMLQIVPVANKQQTGFLMLPEVDDVFELMILNPGVNPVFLPGCLQVIDDLDRKFLKQGGKRYLSGYLGCNLKNDYWSNHFGPLYANWCNLKEKYDPKQTFRSFLYYP
ncbi:FAD-binding oxidoreductase [Legionella fairfieldensis]|uniref:FAD-binding oxidoreductase n=1 Tax=Legionella fairfieldensis TaxID=45064 RepID=UPI00055D00D7|nr:FAD-binding oxidoreductase [Legionella fairfieldensis]